MRVGRRALTAGLVALVSGFATMVLAAPASAAPVHGSVSIDPTAGPPGTLIYVQFQQVTAFDPGCGGFTVIFKWENRQVASARLNHCVAVSSFKAPKDARRGPHPVTAHDEKGVLLGPAAYFFVAISPSTDPTPPTSPPTSPGRSKSPKPGRSSSSDPATDPPLTIDGGPTLDPTLTQSAGPGTGAAAAAESGGGSSALGVALAFGGVLVLGGVVILGMIVARGRREEPEFALAESPTQQIPTYPGGPVRPSADPLSLFDPPPGAAPPPPVPD
jgi:hypothetical protein